MAYRVIYSSRPGKFLPKRPKFPPPENPLLRILLDMAAARRLGLTYEEYQDEEMRESMESAIAFGIIWPLPGRK